MELDDTVFQQILALAQRGETFSDKGRYDQAIAAYLEALALVPNPKEDWETSTWLYATIGTMFFAQKKYDNALTSFRTAEKCPDGFSNPFVLLMIGESSFELQNRLQARDYLLRAYMLEGEELFADEDPKYFQLISDLL